VRRIDTRGTITTVARVKAVAGVSVDPSGTTLAVASIELGVLRIDVASGRTETLAAIGEAGLAAPHGVAYDARGDLWIADPGGHVFRVAAGSATLDAVASLDVFRIVPRADGSAYVVSGDPSGGKVQLLRADGTVAPVAGTGGLGRHVDGIPATRATMLPSDVAPLAGGALLVAQTQPIASVRRIDRAGRITTMIR
jgi:DNA-binding beta-propeller fold protein YncE